MSMENKKPSKGIKTFLGSKKLRYGGFSLIVIIAVIAVIILTNVGITAIDNNWNVKLDVTANKMYKISPQTTTIVKDLKEPIKFIALYTEANATNEITELLNRYRVINPNTITVETIDPSRNPLYANRFDTTGEGIGEGAVIVTNADESRFRVVDALDMFEFAYDQTTYERTVKAFIGEQALTNAMVFVSSEKQQQLYFMTNHAETPLSDYSYVTASLEQLNLSVSEIGLAMTDLEKLTAGDILVVTSPQRDISQEEREQLKNFLAAGGMMMYMRTAGDRELPNFESLLSLYGITVQHDIIVETDQANNQMNQPTIIIPTMENSPITSPLKSDSLVPVLPYVSSFDVSNVEEYGRTITKLLTTSDTAYGKTNLEDSTTTPGEGDLLGPRTVGVTVEQTISEGLSSKIVVLGNSLFITTQEVASYSGNADLFFNSIRWMQGESTAVSIIGKSMVGNRINLTTSTQFYAFAGLVVLVIPLAVLAMGMVVWLKRRHL